MKKILCYFTLLGLLFVGVKCEGAEIRFVPTDDYPTIQAAINASADGDVVKVYPKPEPYASINFAGKHITVESTHGPERTFISGTPTPVTFEEFEEHGSTLDGFTIQDGTQSGIYIYNASPTICNNIIRNNSSPIDGGGIMAINSSASISNNIISDNSATEDGGGIYIFNGSPLIEVNTFMSNEAGIGGGAIAMSGAAPTITHNIIARNTAVGGSAMYVQASSPVVVNNTFTKNTTSDNYGTIYLETSTSMTLMNSILYDNDGSDSFEIYDLGIVGDTQYSYSLIEGTYDDEYAGDGILDEEGVDPLFVNPELDDYSLQSSSPCIDAGHPDDPLSPPDPDGSIADMGAIHFVSHGETGVCGEVGGETWTQSGSPYLVTCNVTVAEGTTLTIRPGVEVRFDERFKLDVDGTLDAVGTFEERILFTSNKAYPSPEDWYGIVLGLDSVNSVIDYATIEYALYGVDNQYSPNLNQISNSIIRKCWYGIAVRSSHPLILNNTITSNTSNGIFLAFREEESLEDLVIKNNIITDNGEWGIHSFYWGDPDNSYNNVWNNGPGGNRHYRSLLGGDGDIHEDPLYGNDDDGDYRLNYNSPCINAGAPGTFDPDGSVADMGALYADATYVSGNVGGQTWTADKSPFIVIYYVSVPEGTTLTIDPGVEVRFDWRYSLGVHGTLDAVGRPNERILFTSNDANPLPRDWWSIRLYDTSQDSVIEHATIEYATAGVYASGMLSPPRISHSIFQRNHWAFAGGSSNAEITNNDIVQNAVGIVLLDSEVVIRNNIIADNAGCGVVSFNELPDISDVLLYNNFWGNTSPYCNIDDDQEEGGVFEDPQFVDPANGNYRLKRNSPCINAGDPDSPRDPDGTIADIGTFYRHQGGGHPPCFLAGTSISMADGSLMSIEKVKPGDLVKSVDAEGKVVDRKVAKLLVHPDTEGYLLVETADGKQLRVTKDHRVLSDGEYRAIGTLTIDSPLTLVKDGKLVETTITSMRKVEGTNTVFNFEVEDTHTYIAEGYAVHNEKFKINLLDPL
ncbi:right-handed parallel beta-helix repeat-containing protein [Candidatus Omnitrophota bacterium]